MSRTLGIMQPYFMPYLGYISLIKHTDEFILFDTVQFIRHGWIERNRVLKPSEGWQYIQVPLIKNNGRDTLIKDILINDSEDWRKKILAQLQHYKKSAPYFYSVTNLLKDILSFSGNDITHLNQHALKLICQYLNISKGIHVFSEMDLEIEPASAPDEWALNICKSMNASSYINPIGGTEFFDRTKYVNAGIDISFQKMELMEYDQKRTPFEPGLSIIDVMMFNTPGETNKLLDAFTLI